MLNLNSKFGPGAARSAYEAIVEKIDGLAVMPERHPIYRVDSANNSQTYRWVVAKKVHRIIYTFEEEEGVTVIRVRYVGELAGNVAIALLEEE